MKIRFLIFVILVSLSAVLVLGAESYFMREAIAEKTIRLHVVANSDSEEDQALKLRVRDRVLELVSRWTEGCIDSEMAGCKLEEHLDELEAAVDQFLMEENLSYRANVSLCQESFPTRPYATFSLPAGTYSSLRVKIGEAKGKNWWCVVFPSLCSAATSEEVAQCAKWNGYEEEESRLITGGEKTYTLRFKLLEWAREIFGI